MKSFIKINRAGSGYVIDYVNDAGGKKRDYVYISLGAVIPPIAGNPGYYLFLGIMFDTVPEGLHKIIFMAEGEEKIRNKLIQKLTDDSVRLFADSIYCDVGQRGFFVALHNSNHNYDLKVAASPENFDYGESLVNELFSVEALNLPPDSILYKQVFDPITGINEADELKEPKFYAFHALRFILAGLERDVDFDGSQDVYRDLHRQRYYSDIKPIYGEQGPSGLVL
jgi:hypothetical protein